MYCHLEAVLHNLNERMRLMPCWAAPQVMKPRVRLQTAKDHLEKALKEASREGCAVTEAELAEHHYKLGRILWTMGGNMRDDPTMARAHFEAASKEECDSQVTPSPVCLHALGACSHLHGCQQH